METAGWRCGGGSGGSPSASAERPALVRSVEPRGGLEPEEGCCETEGDEEAVRGAVRHVHARNGITIQGRRTRAPCAPPMVVHLPFGIPADTGAQGIRGILTAWNDLHIPYVLLVQYLCSTYIVLISYLYSTYIVLI